MKKRKQIHRIKFASILSRQNLNKVSPYEEDILVEKYCEEIDERLEDLEEFLGREITNAERKGMLNVVDKYTPRDKNGEVLASYLPFEYAWEIYELERDEKFKKFLSDWYKKQNK